ncbi:MAG: hypothetical protein WCO44_07040 [Bacteroidota bacterium]
MRLIKSCLLILTLLVLAASSLNYRNRLVREAPLTGYFQLHDLPSVKLFTWRSWFSSSFQDEFSARVNDHAGLRNSLVRIANQVDYTLFGNIHAEGFIRGKEGYLFEEDYIHEYNGDFFIGQRVIDKKLSRLKNVSDSLNKYNIPLLLVYEPGKASFYPEFIPDRFHAGKPSASNLSFYLQRSRELGLPFVDMNSYFLEMKDTARYPLFPRYGMHWSLYGVPLAVDTLARVAGKMTGKQLPRFTTKRLLETETPVGTDNDIGDLLNLACPMKATRGAFPLIAFENRPPANLKVLVIADSYYLNIIEGYGRKLFKTQDYWYYNKKVYPFQNQNPPACVDKSDLRNRLKQYDLVLVMVSEINLHCGFWNFADEAYLAFHPEQKDPKVDSIENVIRNERSWFRFMVKKAVQRGQTLEEAINEDATYIFNSNYNNLSGKGSRDSVNHIIFDIRNNPDWFSQITKKAHDRRITLDSMLMLDAFYCYEQSKKKH